MIAMSTIEIYGKNSLKYYQDKASDVFEILYADRKNQFQELAKVILNKKSSKDIPNWKEFVLNFCLDVEMSFIEWSGKTPFQKTYHKKH